MGEFYSKEAMTKRDDIEFLKKLFINSYFPHGYCVFELTKELKILNCNDSFLRIIGDENTEVFGKSFLEFVSPGFVDSVRMLNDIIRYEHETSSSFIMRTIDGIEKNVYVYGSYFTDENENKYGIFRIIENKNLLTLQKNIVGIMLSMQCGLACYVYDSETLDFDKIQFKYANDDFFEIIGYTREQFAELNNDLVKIVDVEGEIKTRDILESASKDIGIVYNTEFSITSFDKKVRYISCNVIDMPVKRSTHYFISTYRNVTDDKAFLDSIEEKLYFQVEKYKLIEELTDEMHFSYDVSSGFAELSYKFKQKFGIDEKIEGFIDNPKLKKICHPNDYNNACVLFFNALNEVTKGSFDMRIMTLNGEFEWFNFNYASVANKNNKVAMIVGKIVNINEEKINQEKMELQIQKDSMTGLYNKIAIKQKIDEFFVNVIKSGVIRRHALVIIDIDNFKKINDTLGHMFGDIVLENIANIITSTLRTTDLVGRIGGDEFLLLLKDVNHDIAYRKAEEIRKAISEMYVGEYQNVNVSACIGISFFGIDGADYETLFAKADSAMYFSKNQGKNRVTIYDYRIIPKKIQYSRGIEEREDEDKSYDDDLVQYTFNLLANSKDLDSSINILLERIGKRFNLNDVVILEHVPDRSALIETNHWNKNNGIWMNVTRVDSYKEWDGFSMFDDRGVLVLDDCMYGENVSHRDQLVFRKRGIKSLIYVEFTEKSIEGEGFLAFYDYTNQRKWTEYEIETFYQFTKIFSIFISIRKSRKKSEQIIKHLTMFDRHTNTYAIDTFEKLYAKKMEEFDPSKYYALCYSDIDDFSYANDNFGYEAGDELLKCYANILLASEATSLVCRIYSDYFISLYIVDTREELIEIITKTKEDFLNKQKEIYPASDFNISTGVFIINNSGIDVSTAIDNANLARKNIKGKNKMTYNFYHEDLRIARNDEQFIMTSIHRAIAEKKLVVYLQPKVDMTNDEIVGAESLIRWEKYDGKLRFPDEFIPVLEKVGYIVEVDFFALEETLACMRKWRDEGRKQIKLSVNFSRKNNLHDNFVDRIYDLTKKYGIDPKYIEIEVTESSIAENAALMLENLKKIKKLGFSIAIDDFGTGYSSLSMLLSVPADVVKIDKSFLKRYSEGTLSEEYIIKICDLIKAAGKEVLFEGVETIEQKEFLLRNNYNVVQGYLYDKPICVEDFEKKYL